MSVTNESLDTFFRTTDATLKALGIGYASIGEIILPEGTTRECFQVDEQPGRHRETPKLLIGPAHKPSPWWVGDGITIRLIDYPSGGFHGSQIEATKQVADGVKVSIGTIALIRNPAPDATEAQCDELMSITDSIQKDPGVLDTVSHPLIVDCRFVDL